RRLDRQSIQVNGPSAGPGWSNPGWASAEFVVQEYRDVNKVREYRERRESIPPLYLRDNGDLDLAFVMAQGGINKIWERIEQLHGKKQHQRGSKNPKTAGSGT